ncbi:hypothetical protein K0817_010955 [Microbacterium sp. HD4P20]|uniref:hypothetical protein n=1 Tax=Microbacterium sp. HD4P20 TaxID=2864874 RepID=UPI001C6432FE|nr:hypothetical protein [Microbacterium sp. HD4P20]MCP2637075.1 hypothetical protein [Microbacterium sp. HD4P20]
MGVLSRFRRRRTPYQALSEEERIARYVYLLNTLPASVIESAHASAFREVPAERRRAMFEQLRPFMADSERDAATDDPTVLARLVRRAEEHRARRAAGGGDGSGTVTATATRADPRGDDLPWVDARDGLDVRGLLASSGVMLLMANNVLASTAVMTYYTMGAGSLHLASEPGWIGETYDPGAGFDGGAAGAGGADGGMGGGFDGGFGGFGGGFDGGGGFGG